MSFTFASTSFDTESDMCKYIVRQYFNTSDISETITALDNDNGDVITDELLGHWDGLQQHRDALILAMNEYRDELKAVKIFLNNLI